jgi:hypothetical protein
MVGVLAAYGYAREKMQHAWMPLTRHQWIEAMTWPAGGLVSACVGLLL